MNYYLKDIIELYPLENYIIFPNKSLYLTPNLITKLEASGFYNEEHIIDRIKRKYQYNEIATSDVSQFYDLLNSLIEDNYSEYLMNLITISEDYSIQNVDTINMTTTHEILSESENLIVLNDTPSNKLNIQNIKEGSSASNVQFTTDKGSDYKDTVSRESTSALNTTQSNIMAQIEVNKQVQESLNKFVNSLIYAFSIVQEEYYE